VVPPASPKTPPASSAASAQAKKDSAVDQELIRDLAALLDETGLSEIEIERAGYEGDGGPYNLVQLKTIQEAITLTVFMIFTTLFFKTEKLAWNHLVGFGLIVLAVFVIFKKW